MRNIKNRVNLFFMTLFFCLVLIDAAQAKDGIETAGEILHLALPASAAGLTLVFKDREGFVQLSEAGTLTLGVTYGMKYAIDVRRPNGGDHSFPSAHTSTSFATAEFIRGRYGWSYGIPAYVVASFVGYSRVKSKQHHTCDVIAGAVIGMGSGYLFTTPYNGWQIQPLVGSSFYGIGLSCGF
ncbi:MAG: phosphatase PAP2 family protein [Chlorobium sp.]|nr:MAG: phosphatase PAP2 family protein [Chlorobium sp.]